MPFNFIRKIIKTAKRNFFGFWTGYSFIRLSNWPEQNYKLNNYFLEGLGRGGNLLAYNLTRQKIKSSKNKAVGGSGKGKTFISLLIPLENN